MPITKLLSAGTSAANSADLVVAEGEVVSFLLRGTGTVIIEAKDSDGTYTAFGEIRSPDRARQIQGPLTVRARREEVVASWAPPGQEGVIEPVGLDVVTA